MITPEDIGGALLVVLLWAFVAFTWVAAYTCYRDISGWGDAEIADYAVSVIVGLASVTLTILLGLLTLCAVGIVEG